MVLISGEFRNLILLHLRWSCWVLASLPCSRTNHQPSSYLHTQLGTPSADLLASALTKLGLKPWAQVPGTCGVVILGTFLGFSSRGECCQNRPAMSIQRSSPQSSSCSSSGRRSCCHSCHSYCSSSSTASPPPTCIQIQAAPIPSASVER
jgi:hypothetical protein